MREQLKNNYAYLLLAGVIIALIILAVILTSGGSGKTTTETAPRSSGGDQGVVISKGSGIHQGRYYAQLFSFKMPAGVRDISDNYSGAGAEQLTFSFPGGQGFLTSQPLTGAQSFQQRVYAYQGTKHKLMVAGKPGYLILGSTSVTGKNAKSDPATRSQVILVLGQSGKAAYTIQLSQAGSGGTAVRIAHQLAATIKARG